MTILAHSTLFQDSLAPPVSYWYVFKDMRYSIYAIFWTFLCVCSSSMYRKWEFLYNDVIQPYVVHTALIQLVVRDEKKKTFSLFIIYMSNDSNNYWLGFISFINYWAIFECVKKISGVNLCRTIHESTCCCNMNKRCMNELYCNWIWNIELKTDHYIQLVISIQNTIPVRWMFCSVLFYWVWHLQHMHVQLCDVYILVYTKKKCNICILSFHEWNI